MRTALVRTGKFRPDVLDTSQVVPDVVLSSVASFPDWLEQ
jgi:ribonucleotide monophosphatase NagD (HAD superfamily)